MSGTWPPAAVSLDSQLYTVDRKLYVDVYHINIGTGDAAIYYLVEHPPTGSAGKPYIHRACLIDGGLQDQVGSRPIQHFLDRVGNLYDFSTSQGGRDDLKFPPFDSIVITHFDRDHYGGVIDLIQLSMVESLDKVEETTTAAFTGAKNDLPAAVLAAQRAEALKYLSPYMKYQAPSGGSTARGDRAQTFLYLPYWGQMGNYYKGLMSSMAGKIFPWTPVNRRGPPVVTLNQYGDQGNWSDAPTVPSWININYDNISGATYTDPRIVEKVGRLRAGPFNILGADLFTNWRPTYQQCLQIKNPRAMAILHWFRLQSATDPVPASWITNANRMSLTHEVAQPRLILIQGQGYCCGDAYSDTTTTPPIARPMSTLPTTQALTDDQYNQLLANSKAEFEIIKSSMAGPPDPLYPDLVPRNELEQVLIDSDACKAAYDAFDTAFPKPATGQPDTRPFGSFSSTPGPTPKNTGPPQLGNKVREMSNPQFPLNQLDDKHVKPVFATSPKDIPARDNILQSNPPGTVISPHGTAVPFREASLPDHFAARFDPVHLHGIVRVVNTPLGKNVPEYTNAASIGTMVVWTDGQISHYAAGDANWANEMKFVAWIHFGENPFKTVRAMKLQHHGAADSTPIQMVRYLRPRTMIASADTGSHLHPRPELVMWLYLWFYATKPGRLVLNSQSTAGGFGLLQSTAYPYWLDTAPGGTKYTKGDDQKTFGADPEETDQPSLDYKDSLTANAAVLGAGYDLLQTYSTFAATESDKLKRQHQMFSQIAPIWPLISLQLAARRPHGSPNAVDGAHVVYPADGCIDYIKVCCRPFSDALRANLDNTLDGYSVSLTRAIADVTGAKIKPATVSTAVATNNWAGIGTSARKDAALIAWISASTDPKTTAIKRRVTWKHVCSEYKLDSLTHPQRDYDPSSSDDALTQARKRARTEPAVLPTRGKNGGGKFAVRVADRPSSTPLAARVAVIAPASPPTPLNTPTTPFDILPSAIEADWVAVTSRTMPRVLLEDNDPYSGLLLFTDLSALLVNPDNTLAQEDTLRNWLLNVVGADLDSLNSNVTVTCTGTPSIAKVSKLTLSASIKLASTSTPVNVTFNTATLASNFSTVVDVAAIPATGVMVYNMTLLMGLTTPGSIWTLTDILTYMGLKVGSVATLIDDLVEGSHPSFTLSQGMVWYKPDERNLAVQRMAWQIDTSTINGWLSFMTNGSHSITIANALLVAKRVNRQGPAPSPVGSPLPKGFVVLQDVELLTTFDIDLQIGNGVKAVSAALDFQMSAGQDIFLFVASFSAPHQDLTSPHSASFIDTLTWALNALGIAGDLGVVDWMPGIQLAAVRRVRVWCVAGSPVDVRKVSIDVEFSNHGTWVDQDGNDILFLCTYTWTKGIPQPHSFLARVWLLPSMDPNIPSNILANYEPSLALYPSVTPSSRISLLKLMPEDYKPPSELDIFLYELQLDVDANTVSFTGKLAFSAEPSSDFGVVLVEVSVQASYTWGSGKTPDPASYDLLLMTTIELPPPAGVADDDSDYANRPTVIDASIELTSDGNSKFFRMIGECNSLTLAQLVQFFHPEDQSIVNDTLGHLGVSNLRLEYDYDTTGIGSGFSIQAVLNLGPIDLALSFRRDAKTYDFLAMIEVADGIQKCTVADVFHALLGETGDVDAVLLVNAMPSFITDIDLSHGKAKLQLHVVSVPVVTGDKPVDGSLTTALTLDLPGPDGTEFEVAFVQFTNKPAQATTPATTTNARTRTKRLVKVVLEDLPWSQIPKPPIVDKVSPAFDQLGFYWVQDPLGAAGSQGFTVAEMAIVTNVVNIQYKQKATQKPDMIALVGGWHFVVLDSGGHGVPQALLDYAFNQPKADNSHAVTKSDDDTATATGVPQSTPDGTGTSKSTLEKTTSTFRITNVGVRYEGGQLILFLDIIAHLGPIEFALLGFGMGLDLTKARLNDPSTLIPSLHLSGMAIEFNQPPVMIAGMFVDRSDKFQKMYVGGVALTFDPYSFMAVGAYGEVKKPDVPAAMTLADASNAGRTFKTVFIFAKLNGPLIELEFATIGGITLGFGYNSDIKFPTIDQVADFPFLSGSANPGSSSSDPLVVMQKLSSPDPQTGIVTPKDGSFWLAAGLEGKACEILDLSAVVIIEFNPYVSLGIFATAIAQMPPEAPRLACFTFVELEVAATVDFNGGAMRLEAQLTPNSFVMNPLCHLSGGFALCYWFGSNAHAGDFVFTIGGFHPAFDRPSHYPNPDRLAITWGISDNLYIRGEAYFAVTPKAVMGGGALNAVFNLGVLHAYFLAHADFLMTFHPFHFVADIGVEIGVEFDLELLFVTIHISVHISADVHLQGPPFGGYAHVDFWVFGFTVPFGDNANKIPQMYLSDLNTLLMQMPDADSPKNTSTSVNPLHVLSVEGGRFTEKQTDTQTKQGDVWEVKRGGFVFRVQSRIPLQAIDQPDWSKDSAASTIADKNQPFYGTIMHLTKQLTSFMHVTVTKLESEAGVTNPAKDFRVSAQVIKQMPLSIWGPYNSSVASGNNNVQDLLSSDKGTIPLLVGASFSAPPPVIAPDKILPYDAASAAVRDITDDHPQLPSSTTFSATSWEAAAPSLPSSTSPDAQWKSVLKIWEQPELEVMTNPKSDTNSPFDVVQETTSAWTAAFGWDNDPNVLKNDLKMDVGKVPLAWAQFEDLYMAAPMISVS